MPDAIAAAASELDDGVLARVDEIVPPGRMTTPQYGFDGLAWVPWGPHRVPWR